MKHFLLIVITLMLTTATFAQTPVGQWERQGAYLNFSNNGTVASTYDSNTNRKWSSRNGLTYDFFGPNGERLILTLLENGDYFSLSNGQLWKRVSNASANAGGFKGNNSDTRSTNRRYSAAGQWLHPKGGIITILENGSVKVSYDKHSNRKWEYLSDGNLKFTSFDGSVHTLRFIDEGNELMNVQNGETWKKKDSENNSSKVDANSKNTGTINPINKNAIVGKWKHTTKAGVLTFNTDGTASTSWDSKPGRHWKHKKDNIYDYWGNDGSYSEVKVIDDGKEIVFMLSQDHYQRIN